MCRLIAVIALSLWLASPASAGLYETEEPYEFVPRDGKANAQSVEKFRSHLADLRTIAIDSPQPSTARKKIVERRDELSAARRRLSAPELDVLGACYYRLHDLEPAIGAWNDARFKDPRNFAAHSNLALANIVMGDYVAARKFDSAANELKPAVIPGMTKEQTAWYLKVDTHLRKVIRARSLEQGITPDQMRPDKAFSVEFVADDDSYRAGQIAATAKGELPEDAIAIVQQLVLWLPFDARLEWLLAELYNAQGDPATALALLKDCQERGFHPKLLREHRQILQDHFDSLQEEAQKQNEQQGQKRRETFWMAVVVGALIVSGLVIWQLYLWKQRIAGRRT